MVVREQEPQRTAPQFLAEEVYLPGYMALARIDYDPKGASFDFRVKEPPVVRGGMLITLLHEDCISVCHKARMP